MKEASAGGNSGMLDCVETFFRRIFFRILSVGPIPAHIAFIMDGNRRYAKKNNLEEGAGHKAGFSALLSMLKYCFEFGVKYVTVYAFSIDNFRRKPEEVRILMDLMLEKIESLLEEESLVNQYGVRVYFVGRLELLSEPVRTAAEKLMRSTANNTKCALLVCLAYTSTDEILHAITKSCDARVQDEESSGAPENSVNGNVDGITVADIEREMMMAVAPDPDILIRTSGETRLSNFLLWQTRTCTLFSSSALWPEISFRHLVFAILIFQRNFTYLEKKMKQF